MDARQTAVNDQAHAFLADVESAMAPTSYRDDSPVPTVGTAPPVPQPGRPPMSQRATDASALMLSASVASVPIGGMTSLVLYTIGHTDPTSLAIAASAPAALAVPILALALLVKRAKAAAPDVHHHHYNAPVDQRTVNADARGVWAKNQVREIR
ncbi:hypothetical protein ABZ770_42455 [Streptomyces sp. NPDC006654]|uniref:hypothetical protein n=1 Tax=Streptomyces sp. NPDC006654 TaxID=3156897 RepID=UPI003404ABED